MDKEMVGGNVIKCTKMNIWYCFVDNERRQ